MKNIIILSIMLLLLISCEKEIQTIPTPANDLSVNSSSRDNTRRKLYIDCQGSPGCNNPSLFCDGSGGNCLPDVIIVGSALTGLDDAITNHTQTTYFQSADYYTIFGVEEEAGIQEKLEDGDYLFVSHYSAGLYYYIIIPSAYESSGWETRAANYILSFPVDKT